MQAFVISVYHWILFLSIYPVKGCANTKVKRIPKMLVAHLASQNDHMAGRWGNGEPMELGRRLRTLQLTLICVDEHQSSLN
jgi:hypothetical protein